MKQSEAEEIFQAKVHDVTSQSFGTYLETSSMHSNDYSGDSKNNEEVNSEAENKSDQDKYDANGSDEEAIKMLEGSVNSGSMPQMNIFEEKQKESVSLVPKLVKSLMHRKVLKISSGGVHNICIIEPYPNRLASDIYKCLTKSKFTDVCFVFKERAFSAREINIEEDKGNESEENKEYSHMHRPKNKLRKAFYEHRVCAHKFVLASRSQVFKDLFRKHDHKTSSLEKRDLIESAESNIDIIQIKE